MPQYPVLNELKAGRVPQGAVKQDAIGRRVLRADQQKQGRFAFRPSLSGGTPQARRPATYLPQFLEAVKRLGLSPSMAQRFVGQVRQVPNAPGGLSPGYERFLPETKNKQTYDPVLQAMGAIRQRLSRGGG